MSFKLTVLLAVSACSLACGDKKSNSASDDKKNPEPSGETKTAPNTAAESCETRAAAVADWYAKVRAEGVGIGRHVGDSRVLKLPTVTATGSLLRELGSLTITIDDVGVVFNGEILLSADSWNTAGLETLGTKLTGEFETWQTAAKLDPRLTELSIAIFADQDTQWEKVRSVVAETAGKGIKQAQLVFVRDSAIKAPTSALHEKFKTPTEAVQLKSPEEMEKYAKDPNNPTLIAWGTCSREAFEQAMLKIAREPASITEAEVAAALAESMGSCDCGFQDEDLKAWLWTTEGRTDQNKVYAAANIDLGVFDMPPAERTKLPTISGAPDAKLSTLAEALLKATADGPAVNLAVEGRE